MVWIAGLAGLVHACFSAYWAVGGRWLLATVGQWAVDFSAEHRLRAGLVLGGVALVKLLGATIPVAVAHGMLPWPRLWRGISWVGGVLLLAYGAANTAAGLLVVTGVIRPESGYDAAAMAGHAFLWDPLFALWGGALIGFLWLSRTRRGPGSPGADRSGSR